MMTFGVSRSTTLSRFPITNPGASDQFFRSHLRVSRVIIDTSDLLLSTPIHRSSARFRGTPTDRSGGSHHPTDPLGPRVTHWRSQGQKTGQTRLSKTVRVPMKIKYSNLNKNYPVHVFFFVIEVGVQDTLSVRDPWCLRNMNFTRRVTPGRIQYGGSFFVLVDGWSR